MLKFSSLILKNLGRNKLRTVLTFLAVIALVAVFSLIATMLMGLESFTKEKAGACTLMVSDKCKMTMPLPMSWMDDIVRPGTPLNEQLIAECNFDPSRHTLWHFVILSLDEKMKDNDKQFFLLATLPDKVATMTDGMKPEDVDPRVLELMRTPPRSGLKNSGIVLGGAIMKKLQKNIGDH